MHKKLLKQQFQRIISSIQNHNDHRTLPPCAASPKSRKRWKPFWAKLRSSRCRLKSKNFSFWNFIRQAWLLFAFSSYSDSVFINLPENIKNSETTINTCFLNSVCFSLSGFNDKWLEIFSSSSEHAAKAECLIVICIFFWFWFSICQPPRKYQQIHDWKICLFRARGRGWVQTFKYHIYIWF